MRKPKVGGRAFLGTAAAQRPQRLRRESAASQHIPYTAHMDPFVVRTRDGAYLQTLR